MADLNLDLSLSPQLVLDVEVAAPIQIPLNLQPDVVIDLNVQGKGEKGDPGTIQSVNGKTGVNITLNKSDIGLGNVDNTSDANKPISTATQTALNAKLNDLPDVTVSSAGALSAEVSSNVTASGTYTAPTPSASVTAPPQRFRIINRTTGTVTLSFPNPSGTTVNLTVLAGEAITFRQVTTSGYINESGNKPLAQLDARYLQTANNLSDLTNASTARTNIGLGNVDNTSDATKNSAAVTLTNKTIDSTNTVTLKDTNFTIVDDADATKKANFEASGITTATTRTITLPNFNGTMYVTGGTDVSVADGGTGRSTNTTAYGLIAAGTTATNAMQTIAPGTSGQFLKSAGTAALASFANIAESDVTNLVTDLAAKEVLTNKSTTTTLGTSDTLYPSQNAVKTYVDTVASGKQATGNYITALTSDVTASGPGSAVATISNNVVTNAKAAQMAANTIKGNNTGATANASDLTATQTTAMLNNFFGDSGSGGTKGLVPAPATGDAAAGRVLKADGTWGSAGTTSPLTTKGDIYGYSTTNARVPVGTNGQVLTADSTNSLGVSWQNASGGSGSTTNYYNTIKIDYVGGVSPYGALTPTPNSSAAVFTVSNGSYVTGTLEVLQGNVWREPGIDFNETSPASGTFTMTTAPTTGDFLAVRYVTQNTSSGSLPESSITVTNAMSPFTVTTAYKNIYADTTNGPVTLNLLDGTSATNLVQRFKNIGTATSNLARLQPISGQTIDGAPSRTLIINDGITLQANGTDYKVITSYYSATNRAVYGQTTVKSGDTIQANAVTANTFQDFASQYTLPANSLVQGLELVYEGNGFFSSTLAGPSTIARVMVGATEMINTGALNLVLGVSDYTYYFKIMFKVSSVGTSGVIRTFGKLDFQNNANGQSVGFIFGPGNKTVNTTVDNVLKLGAAWTSQTTGNNNTLRDLEIYEVRPPKAAN